MTLEATGAGEALLAGRVLFAVVLGVLAVGNLLEFEETVAYAASEGAPAPQLTVPVATLGLLAGAGSILLGTLPLLGALAVIGFLVGVTPVMHDFWNQEGTDRQNEWIHFLKNVGLAGTALLFAALATIDWPYAIGPAAW